MITKEVLAKRYLNQGQSMQQIATDAGCSLHAVAYWMAKHNIPRRSISDAIYRRHNPNGDPFVFVPPTTLEESQLFGLGIGLYWGEGTKADRASVRLGNTDPKLIELFIQFLVRFYSIKREDIRFGLQVFHDQDLQESVTFWVKRLAILPEQFYKPTMTVSVGKGIYRKKTKYGVLTVYYHNTKLRDIIFKLLPT